MTRESRRSKWIPGRLKDALAKLKTRKPPADQPPIFPLLPSPRPGVLTPILPKSIPAIETDEKRTESPTRSQTISQPSSCLLFSKLPGDVRRDILVLAFGNRSLHMDLDLDYPLHPRLHSSPPVRPRSRNVKEPKSWCWLSTVCHRNPPGQPAHEDSWKGPWNDECRWAWPNKTLCRLYPGEWPGKCLIGIMGFLLSCRQAYAEGIDVLYGANTIVLDSEPLIFNLPQLILPQRLSSIRSLELVLEAHIESPETGERNVDLDHLAPTLDMIYAHFHCLHTFRLSLLSSTWTSPDEYQLDERLRTVDSFYRSMKHPLDRLNSMTLELPAHTFTTCMGRAAKPPPEDLIHVEKETLFCLWRCFESQEGEREPEMQVRTAVKHLKPPLQLSVAGNERERVSSEGYWVAEGNEDRYVSFTCYALF